MTGRTTGPHTHLEVTKEGHPIDPLTILPAISNWPATAGEAPYGAGEVKIEVKKNTPKVSEPKLKLNLIHITEDAKPQQSRLPLLQLDRI